MTWLRLPDMMMIATKLSWLQQIKIRKCLVDNCWDRQCCTTKCPISSYSLILYVLRTQTISRHKLSQDSKLLAVLSTKGSEGESEAASSRPWQALPKKNSICLFNVTLQCNMFRAKFNSFRSQIQDVSMLAIFGHDKSPSINWPGMRSGLSNHFGPKMLCQFEKIGHSHTHKTSWNNKLVGIQGLHKLQNRAKDSSCSS